MFGFHIGTYNLITVYNALKVFSHAGKVLMSFRLCTAESNIFYALYRIKNVMLVNNYTYNVDYYYMWDNQNKY